MNEVRVRKYCIFCYQSNFVIFIVSTVRLVSESRSHVWGRDSLSSLTVDTIKITKLDELIERS